MNAIDQTLLERVRTENRIGALKLLTLEINQGLPEGKRISGYARFKLDNIDELRNLILNSIENLKDKDEKKKQGNLGQGQGNLGQINAITTLSGLKEMAKMLGISGYSKYTSATKEELRALIISHIGGKNPQIPDNLPPLIPGKLPPQIIPESNLDNQIRQIKTISGLIKLVAHLDIPKYRSYRLSQIEDLRRIALDKLNKLLPEEKPEEKKRFVENSEEKKNLIVKREKGCLRLYHQKDLNTTPEQDYQNFKADTNQVNKLKSCLEIYGIKNAKPFGAGTFGMTYLADYMGQSTVFKMVNLEESDFGLEGFKWECVIAERASLIGVGPVIVTKGICYDKNIPKYGILGMGRCSPINMKVTLERKEFGYLFDLISTLHKNGITHRDLGQRNIMKSGDSYVFIDYGLSFAYPGKVPRELELFDYAYLFYDLDGIDWLLERVSLQEAKLITQMVKSFKHTEYDTAKFFPIYMLKTLGLEQAGWYLNKIPIQGSPDDKAVIAILKKRIKDNR